MLEALLKCLSFLGHLFIFLNEAEKKKEPCRSSLQMCVQDGGVGKGRDSWYAHDLHSSLIM